MTTKELCIKIIDWPKPSSKADDDDENVVQIDSRIEHVAYSTATYEFEYALSIFCRQVNKLFPSIGMDQIYRKMSIYILTQASGYRGYFYDKNAQSIVINLLGIIHREIVASGSKSALNVVTNFKIAKLFDSKSKFFILKLIHKFFGRDQVVNIHKEFFRYLAYLSIAVVVLYRVEFLIQDKGYTEITGQGWVSLFSKGKRFKLSELLDEKILLRKIWKYYDEIAFSLSGKFNESIFLKVLLAPQFRIPKVPKTDNFVMHHHKSGRRYRFRNIDFYTHGVAVNSVVKTNTGSFGMTALGCVETNSSCESIIKVVKEDVDEYRCIAAASVKGFGPHLITERFTVQGESTIERELVDFDVYVMDKLSFTLAEFVSAANSQSKKPKFVFDRKDIEEIVDLVLKFEAANFVHHDLKSDNIMVKYDKKTKRRRWYLIDFGMTWYGGHKYDPKEEIKPVYEVTSPSVPYNYRFKFGKLRQEISLRPQGWPRMNFTERPPKFDLCCLFVHTMSNRFDKYPSIQDDMIDTAGKYVKEHLIAYRYYARAPAYTSSSSTQPNKPMLFRLAYTQYPTSSPSSLDLDLLSQQIFSHHISIETIWKIEIEFERLGSRLEIMDIVLP